MLTPSSLAISTASVFTLIAFRLSLMWSLPKVSYMTTADGFVLAITLQTSLGNLAATVNFLLFKPFECIQNELETQLIWIKSR